ncbi:5,6-dimethylbenzimidazole synthase [Deinococcus hopiensis]|uniref:Cob(II)yrinic acid a,c-diamide reductase /5,6-dimethylbenzimidazole synthase n=1 Tax=Deinococcus hopiensis KR-140 TaxID=695939 RepID=A0A1W1UFY6_9DEIO|nr:5,6-dimethylbenzimidazole synthase [Deinococcus hopiensis]SMB79980.1 cob(II)yrinic acid a,c-diamide reductase /5,6-dimethylbenzimidazole synthase [Deinococcus hopiensis KR-140]
MRSGDREALWRVLEARRDHRHFRPDPVPQGALERVLEAFRVAPSVGLSQPWHVTVVRGPDLRNAVYTSFAGVRAREQERFAGPRRALYNTLKLEGIREAPVGLLVSFVPPADATLGTTSLPTALEYSVVSAITLAWLAATAEGLGMGWVSLVEPDDLMAALGLPGHLRPLAYLCLGFPALDLKEPLLQTVGWAQARPLTVEWRD